MTIYKTEAASKIRLFFDILSRVPTHPPPQEKIDEAIRALRVLLDEPMVSSTCCLETDAWIDREVERADRDRIASGLGYVSLATVKLLMGCAYLRGRRDREEEVVYDPHVHPQRCEARG